MINQNKKNNIITYLGIGLLSVAVGIGWYLTKNNIIPTTIVNNLETKIKQSAKLNYIETERNGESCVFYQNTLYEVTTMNVLPSRGLDDAVQRAGVKYSAEEKYLNSQYNKDHGKEGILQPGEEVYVLKKITNS